MTTLNKTENRLQILTDGIKYFAVPALLTVFIFKILFMLCLVPSSSMEPTIHSGSLQIAWRLPYLLCDPQPKRGDIVVFRDESSGTMLVKRVIAVSGDKVEIKNGTVYLNGSPTYEPYLSELTYTGGSLMVELPEGTFFPLGDNRDCSADARSWKIPYAENSMIAAKILFK